MKARAVIVTLLAAGTFAGMFLYLNSVPRAGDAADVERTWVVTANRDLGVGQVLVEQDLTVAHRPAADLPGRALTCADADGPDCAAARTRLVDQTLGMVRFEGEPVTPDMLGPRVELAPHERAIAIPLTAVSGLAGLITPGMEVGIMAVFVDEDSPAQDTTTKFLFDGVRIVWLSPGFRTRAAVPLAEQQGEAAGLAVVALSMEPDAIVYDRQSTLFARALDGLTDDEKAAQGIDEDFIESLREAPDVLWGVPVEMVAAITATGGSFTLLLLPEYPADLTTPGFWTHHMQLPIWQLLSESAARIEGRPDDREAAP